MLFAGVPNLETYLVVLAQEICNIFLFRDITHLCGQMVSAGVGHTVLLQPDGTVVACGSNAGGQCNIPDLNEQGSLTLRHTW